MPFTSSGIKPDIMSIAKGIGGGFPVGACLVTRKVSRCMNQGTHGSTYGGNPLAMAVVNGVLDIIPKKKFLTNVCLLGDLLKKDLYDIQKKYPNRDNIQRLSKNFNPKKIYETLPTSEYTAYSENKGEKLAFCVTKKKGGQNLIDENTLTFVGIHELGHCMSEKIGHGDEFWQNFRFI